MIPSMLVSQYAFELHLCAKRRLPSLANKLHAAIIKLGLSNCEPIPNTLLDVYGKCGNVDDALNVFDEVLNRDQVTWSSILKVFNQARLPGKTLSYFTAMVAADRLEPDNFVFATAVKACSILLAAPQGKQIHARFLLSSFYRDDVVKSALVDMYTKCGLLEAGRAVFDSISGKNAVSWTAMVHGYAKKGLKKEAIDLFLQMPVKNAVSWTALITGLFHSSNPYEGFYFFREMRRDGVVLTDPFVLASMAGCCSDLASLDLGKQVHVVVILLGYESNLVVSNAFVDMYAKCSDIDSATKLFYKLPDKDAISWTSVIVGAAQHGQAKEALDLYYQMVSCGEIPNDATFVGLLYACSHAGMVEKGKELFKSMTDDYGIAPSLQHYTCLVDLYSRSGLLQEAENLIKEMPFEPDEVMWAALLSACKHHGNTQMGLRIADQLLNSDLKNPSTHVLLCNLYARSGMWNGVSMVRKMMKSLAVRTEPGYSSISIGKERRVFHAGEPCQHLRDEIYCLLEDLDREIRDRGYLPDTSSVLLNMGEDEKEKQLFWHSERLALAYGLMKTVPGTVIRIVKNLRTCEDCHTVIKLISEIKQREIIVRDATRYHHFKLGRCSCNDFW